MKLGLQLYTLRDQLAHDLDGALAHISGLGVRYVELAGTYSLSAQEFRERLDAHRLTACGAHVSLDQLTDQLDAVIEDASALGYRYVVLPWVSAEVYRDGWAGFGKSLEPLGQRLGEHGLVFAYHNHAFEFAPEEGTTGLERLFSASDPRWVQAELDLGWIQHAGHDPATWVRSLSGRVPLVHLKDFAGGAEPIDVPAGEGSVEWNSALAACTDSGVEFGIVEMDHPPGDALESVGKCVAFFRNRGLI